MRIAEMVSVHLIDMLAVNDNYSFVLHDDVTNVTAVVDPAQAEPVMAFLNEKGWSLDYILTTHHHWDHVNGNLALKKQMACQVVGNASEAHRIPGIDIPVKPGEYFMMGSAKAQILLLPGHVNGHIGYHFPQTGMLFSGDVIFSMGCGRLFEGTAEEAFGSLKQIAALPDETKIYAAHEYTLANGRFARHVESDNPAIEAYMAACKDKRKQGIPTIPTTVAIEKQVNPFLRTHSASIRQFLGMEEASDAAVFAELRRRKDTFKSA